VRAARFTAWLVVPLLVSCASPPENWVEAGKGKKSVLYVLSESTTYYVDPTTIAKEGNLRKVWEIHDLGEKGAQHERSVLAEVEYDCRLFRMRTVAATGHSLPMGRGEIIPLRNVSDDWILLRRNRPDDAVFVKILDLACAQGR